MVLSKLVNLLFQTAWLFLPAWIANMTPILITKLNLFPRLAGPIDGGKKWKGKRIFGQNKTWRGLICGVATGLIFICLQRYLYFHSEIVRKISIFNYAGSDYWLVGIFLGFGALSGDMIESLVKRQKNIAPGQSWRPWDQIDQAIGSAILVSFIFQPPLAIYVLLLLITFLGVMAINLLACRLGIKKDL